MAGSKRTELKTVRSVTSALKHAFSEPTCVHACPGERYAGLASANAQSEYFSWMVLLDQGFHACTADAGTSNRFQGIAHLGLRACIADQAQDSQCKALDSASVRDPCKHWHLAATAVKVQSHVCQVGVN